MRWRFSFAVFSIVGSLAGVASPLCAAATPPADSARGAEVFRTQACIECHAINGTGGKIGPDLGKLLDRGFTPSSLTATMWNHAPAMWRAMQQRNIQPPALDEQAAADLVAFFYSRRFFEDPGDAGRGKAVFETRFCNVCHGLTESKATGAKPVSEWTALSDPFAMIETMWNHAANMRDQMAQKHVRWPRLSGQDAADLMVYLRNLPTTREKNGAFQATSGSRGEALFMSKGCAACHSPASQFVSKTLAGETLTDIAAGMWNHGLSMLGAQVRFEPGEMREIASYIWSERLLESGGSAERGKKVFAARNCTSCHGVAGSGAPPLTPNPSFSGVSMLAALWRHGPSMLTQMQQRHLSWPRFDAKDMADLIAYLGSRDSQNAAPTR